MEELESFVDLLSIRESELAAAHPDWTKQDLDAFKEEVRDFEEDINLLKIAEEEEVGDEDEEESESDDEDQFKSHSASGEKNI